ncbi:MAG: Regulatory protein RecX [Candidatus Roizmanbacteria bacterium GW2011_GWA2_34_18]|uniref:Regulatory protein RecX n=1 Tax=Candidatus Roizmanbacteria bacterium GW2011_GWA2_34_18 TaxID=1618477 RepID=A0A0G0B9A0_9BACT|nr:MAG: Regulatory protein RecX [Candidatus Roizmanbacteria bacterium GW2011_GWA2_34_18]
MNDDLIPLLNMAFFYLKFRPRTIKETRDYLYKKVVTTHWSHEAADKVIDHLIEQKFLDDQEFVRYLVESRTRTKVKGVFAIKQELFKYGVEKEFIDEYFAKTEINEEALAEKILVNRWPRLKTLPKQKRFEKAVNLLARRGFNFEISRKTVEKLEDKN